MADYCTAQDVAKFIGIDVGVDTVPDTSTVEEFIEESEDEIDFYTHHAWRTVRKENEHYNFHGFVAQRERFGDWSDRARIYLKNRNIQQLVKLEVWDGSHWEEFIGNYTEDRYGDYWVDYDRGIIHFANRYPWRMRHSIRVTYDYGLDSVPKDIKRACTLLTASYMIQQDDYSVLLPEGTSNIPPVNKAKMWEERAYKIMDRHVEIKSW
ncbi:MAG: Uncharacterized protein CI952_29 [Methanohalophilus sp.]|jgi:hypothetical protein|nr:MAG: Uncharacterized protein CI952_29 [Methanohalophilus sp.]